MGLKTDIKRTWTGKKAPFVTKHFEAEVPLDSQRSVPLQEMANRHRKTGDYMVKQEVIEKQFPRIDYTGKPFVEAVQFIKVSITRNQESLFDERA